MLRDAMGLCCEDQQAATNAAQAAFVNADNKVLADLSSVADNTENLALSTAAVTTAVSIFGWSALTGNPIAAIISGFVALSAEARLALDTYRTDRAFATAHDDAYALSQADLDATRAENAWFDCVARNVNTKPGCQCQ